MSAEYDYSQPRSFGYASGSFQIKSPWAGEPCEACVIACSFGDIGGLFLSTEAIAPASPSQTQATNQEGVAGFAAFTQAVGAVSPVAPVFFLVPRGVLNVSVTVASAHVVWFTLVFRRALGKFVEFPQLTEMSPEAEDAYHRIQGEARLRAQADAAGRPGPRAPKQEGYT